MKPSRAQRWARRAVIAANGAVGVALAALCWPRVSWTTSGAAGSGYGTVLALLGAFALVRALWILILRRKGTSFEALGVDAPGAGAIAVIVGASILEEVAFRGVVQPALGLPIAALLFGLTHVDGEALGLRTSVVMATLLGFLLGWVAQEFGFVAAVLLHVGFNLSAVVACHVASRVLLHEECDEVAELGLAPSLAGRDWLPPAFCSHDEAVGTGGAPSACCDATEMRCSSCGLAFCQTCMLGCELVEVPPRSTASLG